MIGADPRDTPNNLMPYIAQVAVGRLPRLRVFGNDYPAVDGTGRGHSVLEVVQAFEAASGRSMPYAVIGRRAGDVAVSFADAGLARRYLGWQAEHGLDTMCSDAWRWQSMNRGYSS